MLLDRNVWWSGSLRPCRFSTGEKVLLCYVLYVALVINVNVLRCFKIILVTKAEGNDQIFCRLVHFSLLQTRPFSGNTIDCFASVGGGIR